MRISDWSSDVCSSDLGVGLQAVALHLPGDVDEGAIKRIAGQREEGDQAQARGHELARLQRTRPPRQQPPALPALLLIGSSRQRRLAVWTCSGSGMSSGAPEPVPAARETDPLCPTAVARGAAVRSAFVAARNGEARTG